MSFSYSRISSRESVVWFVFGLIDDIIVADVSGVGVVRAVLVVSAVYACTLPGTAWVGKRSMVDLGELEVLTELAMPAMAQLYVAVKIVGSTGGAPRDLQAILEGAQQPLAALTTVERA